MTPSATPPLPDARFREDPAVRAAYAEGAGILRMVPRAVALPETVEEVCQLIRWAETHHAPLVPRGAGSGMGGGNIGPGVVVDLTRLENGVAVDPAGTSATTGAACTIDALNRAAGEHGLRMPAAPSSSRFATAGGAVATNAAGPRTCAFGATREWVRGVTLATAGGEVVRLDRGTALDPASPLAGRWRQVADRVEAARDLVTATFPRTRKNSSGYAVDAFLDTGDLLDLVIGSEGTLGIVTEVRWDLQPVPEARRTVRIALHSLDRLDRAVRTLSAFGPSAIELLDRTFLQFVADAGMDEEAAALARADALLLVEFEGQAGDPLDATVSQVREALGPDATEIRVAATEAEATALWAIRHAASPILADLSDTRRSLQVIEDGAVPPDLLGEYVLGVRQICAAYGVTAVLFGHAGDGHVHVNLLPDVTRGGWKRAVQSIFMEVSDLVFRLGGTPSGEHGDGRLRAPLVPRLYGPEMTEVFEAVRGAFDPARVFNPGVILPMGPVWDHLKVGRDAVPIPPDIAEGLRTIERTGGYGIARTTLVERSPTPRRTRYPDAD